MLILGGGLLEFLVLVCFCWWVVVANWWPPGWCLFVGCGLVWLLSLWVSDCVCCICLCVFGFLGVLVC